MSFSEYARNTSERKRRWSARPLFYNPNYPVISFFITYFAALGVVIFCALLMSWLNLIPLDDHLFEKPFPLLTFAFGGVGAWIGEAVAYRRFGNGATKMMIGPDQPAEKTV